MLQPFANLAGACFCRINVVLFSGKSSLPRSHVQIHIHLPERIRIDMPKLTTLICLTLLILIPHKTTAETVILKNGKTIQSDKCWEDGELIKCKLYGQTIGYSKSDVTEYRSDSKPVPKTQGFQFDIWSSGLSVTEVIDIAEANNKPIHRDGLISSNKVFNPKMCRPYQRRRRKAVFQRNP